MQPWIPPTTRTTDPLFPAAMLRNIVHWCPIAVSSSCPGRAYGCFPWTQIRKAEKQTARNSVLCVRLKREKKAGGLKSPTSSRIISLNNQAKIQILFSRTRFFRYLFAIREMIKTELPQKMNKKSAKILRGQKSRSVSYGSCKIRCMEKSVFHDRLSKTGLPIGGSDTTNSIRPELFLPSIVFPSFVSFLQDLEHAKSRILLSEFRKLDADGDGGKT